MSSIGTYDPDVRRRRNDEYPASGSSGNPFVGAYESSEHFYAPLEDDEAVRDKSSERVQGNRLRRFVSSFFTLTASPEVYYTTAETYRHRDRYQRVHFGPEDDRYLDPVDGSLKPLAVQTSEDILYNGGNTWPRKSVKCVASRILRTAICAFSTPTVVDRNRQILYWSFLCMRWLTACFSLFVLMPWATPINGKEKNRGNYDKLLCRTWQYAKVARNRVEQKPHPASMSQQLSDWTPTQDYGKPLLPRYLCFLNRPESKEMHGVRIEQVSYYLASLKDSTTVAYSYISYISDQFTMNSKEDLNALHLLAERATRDARLTAYWIACGCMPEAEKIEQDVYRMDSFNRNASKTILILGRQALNYEPSSYESEKLILLQQWGTRLWTRPELVNSSQHNRIEVYMRGEDPENHWSLTKRELAVLVWQKGQEAHLAMKLLDHYEGVITLGSLELFLSCIQFFLGGGTVQYLPGDLYYVLMGVLPRRPRVDQSDTSFQAFARLCLANENNQLLERLICMLSTHQGIHWATCGDAWDVNLWDIHPNCQVAGISHDDTLIIDGAFGSTIRWDSLERPDFLARDTALYWGLRTLVRGSPLLLVAGVVLTRKFAGAVALLVISSITILGSPLFVMFLYSPVIQDSPGQHYDAQPHFFGIEGYVPLPEIEKLLYGMPIGRLKWSESGSVLSRHSKSLDGKLNSEAFNECMGFDPTLDPRVAHLVDMAENSRYGKPKVFTLIDTFTRTVMLFMAVRPPVAVLCCGQEGGMQRALLCSYDWKMESLFRETVLRMETPVLDRMTRVGRVRMGLERKTPLVKEEDGRVVVANG